MTNPERRYNEDEIAAIFKQAAADQDAAQRHLAHNEGLTLAELQQIGKEAGITPDFIARAATAVGIAAPAEPATTYLGIPITVARTVDLPGPLSDEGWEQLVIALRETFQASGKVRRDGLLRQWRNGNLQALIEPTASGHRLRLRTLNGNARGALLGGLAALAISLAIILIGVVSGKSGMEPDILLLALMGVAGLGSMGMAAYRLPRWAEERDRQMKAIAARAVELAGVSPAAQLREPTPAPRLDLDTLADVEYTAQTQTQRRTRSKDGFNQ